jgi:hypothetical protein
MSDLRKVPSPDEARERVRFLVARSQEFRIMRWAIVVSGTAHYGMGRLAEFVADRAPMVSFRVFKDDPSQAMAWAKGKEARGGNVA